MLCGSASGSLETVNWLKSQVLPGTGGAVVAQKASLTLKLQDISFAALMAALRTRRLPLERLHLAGSLGGTLETRWTGSVQLSETSFKLQAAPPLQLKTGEVPLAGAATGVYRA